MQSKDKDQTWKTDIYSKEHKVIKIIHTKQQKQISNSDFPKNLIATQGALVEEAYPAPSAVPVTLHESKIRQESSYNNAAPNNKKIFLQNEKLNVQNMK